jgi:hypothetical protein
MRELARINPRKISNLQGIEILNVLNVWVQGTSHFKVQTSR